MHKLVFSLLAPLLLAFSSHAQVVINSVGNGNFSAPSTWDCNCIPSIANCDWIYVHHDVTLDQDLPNSPSIAIQPNASLIEDSPRSVSEVEILGNYGMLDVSRLSIGVSGGGQYTNNDSVFVDDLFIMDGNTLNNMGFTAVDDTFYLEEDVVFVNTTTGTMETSVVYAKGGLINNGDFEAIRVMGMRKADNTLGGSIGTSGSFACDDLYAYAGFTTFNGGLASIADTLLGDSCNINVLDSSSVNVGSFCVSQNHVFATYEGFIVHGTLLVDGDFYIDPNAVLTGSGSVCVAGVSTSDGHIYASGAGNLDLDFCDFSGNGQFDFLNGTIDPTYITYCSASSTCAGTAAVEERESVTSLEVFPNPALTTLQVSGPAVNTVSIYDATGKLVLTDNDNTIDVSALPAGLYFVEVFSVGSKHDITKFIKH